jgi:hypothetical protein
MTDLVFGGIFGIGFVFGYLLYYAVRHTNVKRCNWRGE